VIEADEVKVAEKRPLVWSEDYVVGGDTRMVRGREFGCELAPRARTPTMPGAHSYHVNHIQMMGDGHLSSHRSDSM